MKFHSSPEPLADPPEPDCFAMWLALRAAKSKQALLCHAKSPTGAYCTRDRNHLGAHIAHGNQAIMDVWK